MKNNYIQLLEHSYRTQCNLNEDMSRLAFLGDFIFFFTTYDSEMAELFASKALEVCAIISDQTAFTYIDDADNYRWYLLMINMPFFARRLNWGTSIRGAWWNHEGQALETCGLWEGDDQTLSLTFTRNEWRDFIAAMTEFAEPDKAAIADPVKNADEPKRPTKEHIHMLADQIIADYKEHYDFPSQGESHMHDCITDDLKKYELAAPFNDGFYTDKKVKYLLENEAELVGAVLLKDDQHAIIIKGNVNWYPADAKHLSERAIGRAEALAIILREDCEEPFANMVNSCALADTGDYSYHWDEEKMRHHFLVDQTAWSLLCNIEAMNIDLDFRLDEATKDQARYQYLRSRDLETIDKGGLFVGMTPDNIVINLTDLDELVDDAMQKEAPCNQAI